jgi:hypothetical protein
MRVGRRSPSISLRSLGGSKSNPNVSASKERRMPDWAGSRIQADAQTILCPDCHAPIGQTCLNTITGKPLERFPAHINRINKSKESK